jgi:hypothetical protein
MNEELKAQLAKGAATITRTSSLSELVRATDATQAACERRGYAGSLAPSTSSDSIAGGTVNSTDACAMRACAIGPFR